VSLRIVVTGTDTGIGKTVFSAGLTDALGGCYWKPIQSGLDEETDSEVVARLGQISSQRIMPEVWRLNTPVSPHLSAEIDGLTLTPGALQPPATSLPLVIEGAGGLLVPLTRHSTFADVFARWQIPAILCARTGLGTINHTLLSVEAMRQRLIPILGVAFIGDEYPDTQRTIEQMGHVRILGRLPFLNPLVAETLRRAMREQFDVSSIREAIT
jgi:dethiobiotin synthetase